MDLVLDSGRGVLIVEDDAMIAMHLEMILGDAGFPVLGVAKAAAEALALANEACPKAAVVDIRLGPGPDGIHVAERLLADCECRVVFVSGSGEPETLARISRIKGAVFLQKPVDPTVLINHVRVALGSA